MQLRDLVRNSNVLSSALTFFFSSIRPILDKPVTSVSCLSHTQHTLSHWTLNEKICSI